MKLENLCKYTKKYLQCQKIPIFEPVINRGEKNHRLVPHMEEVMEWRTES